jgi:hypothetical protein
MVGEAWIVWESFPKIEGSEITLEENPIWNDVIIYYVEQFMFSWMLALKLI